MFKSIFTDELGMDLEQALPILKSWGLNRCDLRSKIMQMPFEKLEADQLRTVKTLLDNAGFRLGCLESSLAKVHLPGPDVIAAEADKLERIIQAADILDCRLVRSFFFWQPPRAELGDLATRPELLAKVLDAFQPLAQRAREAGLILAFENCGCTTDECFTVLDALAIPTWGFAWDAKNTWEIEKEERLQDLDAFIRRRVERALVIHVKAIGSAYGEERIPYDRIFAACQKLGFTGPVSIETHNPDREVTPVEMSRRVLDVVERAWPAAAAGVQHNQRVAALNTDRPWVNDPVRFAVVGLGMGHNRSNEIIKTPGLKLVKVCDKIEARAQRTAEATGAPWTTDFQDILRDPDVEAVMVLNETGRHNELACQALDAGKHVLVTKPMDMTTAACDRMIASAKQNNRLLAVDHSFRLRQHIMELRQALADNWFGRVLNAAVSLRVLRTMDYFNANGGWRGTRLLDGGVLSNQSVHHIDELLFCLGAPAAVRADVWNQNHHIEMEDMALAVWKYDSGLVVHFLATTNFPQSTWYHQLELHGDQGAFIHREGGALTTPETTWFKNKTWQQQQAPVTVSSPWLNAMDNFAAALRTDAPLLCSADEGRAAVAIINAMYESAYNQKGQWVTVNV